MIADPFAAGELLDLDALQAPCTAVIDVLDTGRLLEPGVSKPGSQRAVFFVDPLALDQQGEAVLEAQLGERKPRSSFLPLRGTLTWKNFTNAAKPMRLRSVRLVSS
jgi:hypothetical protein